MRFVVQGMSCEHCVRSITDAVTKLKNEVVVKVSLKDATVDVEGIEDRQAVVAAIEAQGYEVHPS